MKRVLVFGGSFSPPTLAHEAIIAQCLGLAGFDAVWVLPSGDRADKTIAFHDADRLAMLNLLRTERFASDPRLKVMDFELALPRPTQTHQTVQALSAEFPDTEFWFVFGTDAYLSMPSWSHGRQLQDELGMVLFGRDEIPEKERLIHLYLEEFLAGMSSTHVRSALAKRESVGHLVSEPIARYLMQNSFFD